MNVSVSVAMWIVARVNVVGQLPIGQKRLCQDYLVESLQDLVNHSRTHVGYCKTNSPLQIRNLTPSPHPIHGCIPQFDDSLRRLNNIIRASPDTIMCLVDVNDHHPTSPNALTSYLRHENLTTLSIATAGRSSQYPAQDCLP